MPNLATQHALIRDEVEERDVVHSRVVPVSEGRFLDIGERDFEREVGDVCKTPSVPWFEKTVHPCTKKTCISTCPSCPCRETLQVCG